MRDLIWTLIGIWVLYQLSQAFGVFKTQKTSKSTPSGAGTPKPTSSRKKQGEQIGEYVDFEEIKD